MPNRRISIGECNVPCGEQGSAEVDETIVTEEEAAFSQLRAAVTGRAYESCKAGIYKRLLIYGILVMSNTPMECDACRDFVERAEGRVLINGLGLGMVLTAVLKKPDVTFVRVIEKNADVIALVAPSFHDPRLEIIHADALEYKPARGEKYDAVWHDIWNDICSDNLEEMNLLHRRYARRSGWQGSWSRDMILAYR